jgi:hypothetical protein
MIYTGVQYSLVSTSSVNIFSAHEYHKATNFVINYLHIDMWFCDILLTKYVVLLYISLNL